MRHKTTYKRKKDRRKAIPPAHSPIAVSCIEYILYP